MNLRSWSLCGERKLLFEKTHLILGQGSISPFPWCKVETFLRFCLQKNHCHYLTHRRLFKKRKKIKTLPRKGVVDIRKLLVPMTRTREKWNLPETKSSRKDFVFQNKKEFYKPHVVRDASWQIIDYITWQNPGNSQLPDWYEDLRWPSFELNSCLEYWPLIFR